MYSYLGMVMHACSPSVWEEEESEVQWDHKKHLKNWKKKKIYVNLTIDILYMHI